MFREKGMMEALNNVENPSMVEIRSIQFSLVAKELFWTEALIISPP